MIALEAELALAELAATWVQYTSRINGTRSELGFDPGARLLRLTYGITDSRHRYHCLTRTSGELVNAV
jgi:hypothetical protein